MVSFTQMQNIVKDYRKVISNVDTMIRGFEGLKFRVILGHQLTFCQKMYPFREHQFIDGSKMHAILHRQCIDDTKLSAFLRLIGINVRFCEQSAPVNKLTVYFIFYHKSTKGTKVSQRT
jgi:hypothetical protein